MSELADIAKSLTAWAVSLAGENDMAARALRRHARHLRRLCAPRRPADRSVSFPPGADAAAAHRRFRKTPACFADGQAWSDSDATEDSQTEKERENAPLKPQVSAEPDFRERALAAVERGGCAGECVADLREVSIGSIKDKLAISYWRFCGGLRLYRSETVTEALRLLCSAPVPGLGGPTYLEVFDTLTQANEWEHHIYLFGGLVRDILRRSVGNDIDIGFSAPAAELESICRKAGYRNRLDGDYIVIGEESGEGYLEGMVISHNGIQRPEHADFSMNTLFYDFSNDVIVDKTGNGVPAVLANRCDIPCPRDRWQSWIEINGVRVCFRFYKFLLRGYAYETVEMLHIADSLLYFWGRDAQHTINVGRDALGELVASSDAEKIGRLRQLVLMSFDTLMQAGGGSSDRRKRPERASTVGDGERVPKSQKSRSFLSAKSWWQQGWLALLKLPRA